jgi:hypothetical protein
MTKVTGPVPLLLKSPMVPPALISPAAIPSPSGLEMEKWELFLMAIRSLHIGPLLTLSRLISVVKEILELRAYCYCEESKQRRKNRAIRRKSETSSSRSDESADDEAVSVSDDCEEEEDEEENRENYRPSRRFAAAGFNRITSSGAHYNMSKSRLEALETTQLSVEIHLLEMDQVLLWFRFYSACCDWLLKLNPSTKTSAAFASFPEHFFFDLCSLMHLLGAVPYVMSGNTEEEPLLVQSLLSEEGTDNCSVLTPLITMLFQLIGNSSITSNPHLRVEALKASCSLMSFLSQYKQSRPVLREIFKSYELQQQHKQSEETEAEEQGVSGSIVEGLVKFHAQMEHYHLRNTDSHLQQGVNGANIPNGPGDIVAIRLCTSLLIRFLWQFPRLRRSFESCMRKNTVSLTGSGLSLLLNGLWSDATRVLEDTTSKIFLLKRLLELQEASLEADSRNNTQLRPAMMEGYVVLHTKQLRLSFRTLIEVLELLNWTMNQSTLKRTLLKPELMDQSARTISFLMITIGKTLDKENSLQEIMEELKLALAFVMFLLVRCGTGGAASTSGLCSETCFWKLSQYAAQRMLCRVGDLDTHARWSINSYVNRLESTKYLGDNMQEQEDDDEVHHDVKTETQSKEIELDEHEALSLLEKQQQQQKATRVKQYDLQKPSSVGAQTEQQLAKTLSKRFISALANDGRFDSKQFMALIHFTRRKRHQRGHNSDMTPEYKYVDAAWVQQFEQSINQAQEMIQVHANIEKLLGDIPQQYLDPLLNTLMTDPVKLPSGHVVDRAVIERHLLSSQSQRVDPFTREPLSLEMLEPCEQLTAEIHMYLMACVKNLEKKEDILATWGVAWNTIFEEEKPPATASNIDPDGQEATIQEEDSK